MAASSFRTSGRPVSFARNLCKIPSRLRSSAE